MASGLRLVNVNLPLRDEESLYALVIQNGVWSSIEAQSAELIDPAAVSIDEWDGDMPEDGSVRTLDLQGKVLLPGLVDAHMHLDKSFSLPMVGNESGTLEEAVRNYSAAAPQFTKEEIKSRIMRAALQAMSYGTTAIRTHLDFHTRHSVDVALRTVEAALEVKEALKPYVDIQLFPMCPYNELSAEALEAAEESIRMGVTGLGGAPHLSPTPESDIDHIFHLAEKYGCPVDLHTDESDNPQVRTLAHIAKRTMEYGWSERVTVDHLCSLAAMPDEDAEPLIELMAEAGLGAVTLPGANLYLQGRHDGFPARRGVTRVKSLLSAGVPIATASDNIHDPFHPFGRGDLVQIALTTAYAAHMGSPADLRSLLRMITEIPAAILGLKGYGVEVGRAADFVVFDGTAPEELFTLLPERRWVWRAGSCLLLPAGKPQWKQQMLGDCWADVSAKISFRCKESRFIG